MVRRWWQILVALSVLVQTGVLGLMTRLVGVVGGLFEVGPM